MISHVKRYPYLNDKISKINKQYTHYFGCNDLWINSLISAIDASGIPLIPEIDEIYKTIRIDHKHCIFSSMHPDVKNIFMKKFIEISHNPTYIELGRGIFELDTLWEYVPTNIRSNILHSIKNCSATNLNSIRRVVNQISYYNMMINPFYLDNLLEEFKNSLYE